jgi:hypothetical protein
MKSKKIALFTVIIATTGFIITGCKKESNSPPPVTFSSQQIAQVQNSDIQDAISEKADQDIDKTVDQLQVSNYKVTTAKSALTTGSLAITVNYPDSTTFPKVITLVYTNYQDSTADESFVKNGEVDIIVTANSSDKQLTTRAFTFKNFSITTDSTTFTVNGIRTLERTGHTFKFNGLQNSRFTSTDNITANLSYAITKTGVSDTLKFTRIVSRVRKAFLHFDNIGGATWRLSRFRIDLAMDTISYSGLVTGVNERGEPYSKTVSPSTPLLVTFYRGTPVISSGIMTYSITTVPTPTFTIAFEKDPYHPRMTLITVTNNSTNESYSFDRQLSRLFRRWW